MITPLNRVWSFDFIEVQTHDGRRLRLMMLVDEFTRKCPAIRGAEQINAVGVIAAHAVLFEGMPAYMGSDNGPEMIAKVFRQWLVRVGTNSLYIEPRSPWENRYNEQFNGAVHQEVLNAEWFTSPKQAQTVAA